MSTDYSQEADNRFLRPAELADRYGVSRPTIDRWTRDGVLPEPLRLNGASPRWRLSALIDWEMRQGARG